MNFEIIKADYTNARHCIHIPLLLDEYARDPMGGGKPLDRMVKASLVSELAKRPYAFSVIAYADNQPSGLVNCFEAFSTFAGKPLVSIHDFVVAKEFRGNNISQLILQKVDQIAREKDCCIFTL